MHHTWPELHLESEFTRRGRSPTARSSASAARQEAQQLGRVEVPLEALACSPAPMRSRTVRRRRSRRAARLPLPRVGAAWLAAEVRRPRRAARAARGRNDGGRDGGGLHAGVTPLRAARPTRPRPRRRARVARARARARRVALGRRRAQRHAHKRSGVGAAGSGSRGAFWEVRHGALRLALLAAVQHPLRARRRHLATRSARLERGGGSGGAGGWRQRIAAAGCAARLRSPCGRRGGVDGGAVALDGEGEEGPAAEREQRASEVGSWRVSEGGGSARRGW